MMVQRRGIALLVAILVLLAVSVLSAASFAVAARHARALVVWESAWQARIGAEGALHDVLATWDPERNREHAVGEPWVIRSNIAGLSTSTVRAERLTRGLTLLRATSRTGHGRATAEVRVAALVRTVHPFELLAAFPGAVTVSQITLDDARVDGLNGASMPGESGAADCPPNAGAALDSVFGTRALPGVVLARSAADQAPSTAGVTGRPPVAVRTDLAAPRPAGLGPVPWPLLPRIADEHLALEHRGAPDAPGCDGQGAGIVCPRSGATFVFVEGDLELRGTATHGLLVVDGDLTLSDARHVGALLVRGTVRLTDGASVEGAIRAGRAEIRTGTVLYRACAVLRAVAGPALQRPFRPGPRWWLPGFGIPAW